ncbi:hypothetical protein [Cutibacterium sp. V947]
MRRGDRDGSAQPPPIKDQMIVVGIDADPEMTYTIGIVKNATKT